MNQIRNQSRLAANSRLTIPQFRILANISVGRKHVSQIACHVGVSQPSMSQMIETLVNRGLVKRSPMEGDADRRQIALHLTEEGQRIFDESTSQVQKILSGKLKNLSEEKKISLSNGLEALRELFLSEAENLEVEPGAGEEATQSTQTKSRSRKVAQELR